MSIFKIFRKPNLILLMASMVLYASCNQYEVLDENVLSKEQIELLKKSTLDFINNPENYKNQLDNSLNKTSNPEIENKLLEDAIMKYAEDDLVTFKINVKNYSEWNNEEMAGIEATFVVLETMKANNYNTAGKANFELKSSQRGAWWAPIGFWGICAVVTVLSAGVACGLMFATALSYSNYVNQE
jgi:hypothetical protein